jgi:hypothetical protein
MEIQDWCRQGLRTSVAGQRRAVEAETASTTPRPTASSAGPGPVHLDRGTSDSTSSPQAIALTSATCAGVSRGGRPDRPGCSGRPNPRRRDGRAACAPCPAWPGGLWRRGRRTARVPRPARSAPAARPGTGSCPPGPSSTGAAARRRDAPPGREGRPWTRAPSETATATPDHARDRDLAHASTPALPCGQAGLKGRDLTTKPPRSTKTSLARRLRTHTLFWVTFVGAASP